MDIQKGTQLLEDFLKIPLKYRDSTYLELCHYPKRRFEEICSRLLAFYFDPNKEHGFTDLFISSLMQLLQSDIIVESNQFEIITEDNEEGRRIDLVIIADDFVIGIENKITASLYNPLGIYKRRLEKYRKNKTIAIVLSVFDIAAPNEIELMKKYGFQPITYNKLFGIIKRNIGSYITYCNPKYLTHLYDFIDTIENMKTSGYKNNEISSFFIDNEEKVQRLINAYDNHKKELRDIHRSHILDLMREMKEITRDKWDNYQDYFLVTIKKNSENKRIGIEGNFKPSNYDPIDKFIIYLTTWNQSDFNYYRDKLSNKYPEKILHPIYDKNKTMIEVASVKGNDFEQIINELTECHKFLVEIYE